MPSPLAPDTTQVSPLAAQNAPSVAPQSQQQMPSYDMTNYNAAMQHMQLTPQEQSLYQMHLNNLYGSGGVDNPDGTRSTLFQKMVGFDDKTYVIPTVWGGQIVPIEQAIQLAKQQGLETFPSYSSGQEAEARYQQMHGFMEQDTTAYEKGKK